MRVTIRHIDTLDGNILGDIKPSEIQPLINLFKSNVPVYNFSDSLDKESNGFENCRYSSHQIIKYEDQPYVLEIVVDGPV